MAVWKSSYLQGFLLLFIIGLMFLPIPMSNLWWKEVFNTGHIFVFMAFAFLLAKRMVAINLFTNIFMVYLACVLLLMLAGGAVELVQGQIDREMSWGDLQNDLLGVMAGLLMFHANRMKSEAGHAPTVLFAVAAAFILLGSFSFVQLSWHYVQREQAFPVIADFGARWSDSFVRFNKVRRVSYQKSRQAGVVDTYAFEFSPGRYPGMTVIELEEDWSGYKRLRFSIYSTYKEKIVFVLRIHDSKHNQGYFDRFNSRLTVSPGMNDIVFDVERIKNGPMKRQLDIKHIAGLTLFLMKFEQRHTFEISKMYLE